MILDDVFLKEKTMWLLLLSQSSTYAMIEYGYDIIKTLVTDIDPDAQVKAAMNRINAAEREKVAAAVYEGEAASALLIVAKAPR